MTEGRIYHGGTETRRSDFLIKKGSRERRNDQEEFFYGRAAGLLAFKFVVVDSFEDGKAGLFGFGDGSRGQKFRGSDLLDTIAGDGLTAGGAGGEGGVGGGMPVVEAFAAEFAGGLEGDVAVNGHGR
jgi:hypothetical protein